MSTASEQFTTVDVQPTTSASLSQWASTSVYSTMCVNAAARHAGQHQTDEILG